MPKEEKKTTKEEVLAGFEEISKTLDLVEQSARKSYMPLLADSLKLSKDILELYKNAFKNTLKD